MRYIRFFHQEIGITYGWINLDKIGLIEGNLFGQHRRLKADYPIETIKMIAPIVPGKIVCVGRNYVDHAKEQGAEIPDIPLLFFKPPTAVIGPGEPILIPPQSKQVEHEAELAVVIKKTCRWTPSEQVKNHILGYTIANDVTARDLQRRDGQWTRGKGFDTFCPIGPWIETEFDPADALITCKVNGVLRQLGSTREMVFPIEQLIAYISSIMTLLPGDIILTGTPAGVGPLIPNDEVEITIDGLGGLSNPVENLQIPKN